MITRILRALSQMAAVSLAVAASSPSAAPALSDSAAAQVIMESWAGRTLRASLGEFEVYGGVLAQGKRTDWQRRRITQASFDTYLAWQAAGILAIDTLWDGTAPGWQSMANLDRMQEGVVKQVRVRVTPQGEELQRAYGNAEPNTLSIRSTKFSAARVIGNEALRLGADDYRVVRLTYKMEWVPATLPVLTQLAGGIEPRPDRKAIVLLKFDPFKNRWQEVTGDATNQDRDFSTSRVDDFIKAQQGARR